MHGDAHLRQDYETMLARFDDFCACSESGTKSSRSSGRVVHSEECSLLDDYLALCAQHELPYRVFSSTTGSSFLPTGGSTDETLVLQCFLVAGQAAIDGLDPKFKGKPSKQTLTLQQKALCAMQKLISKRPNTVDDSLVVASAVLMSTAVSQNRHPIILYMNSNAWQAYFDDQDAYKAHKSSLQKLIDLQGGMNQTRTHRMVSTISNTAEICLAMYRYNSMKPEAGAGRREAGTLQFPAQSPFKLKYPMPPFAPEVLKSIERMSPGFQALAKASKLSVQALQLMSMASKWSMLIDQPLNSDAEQKQLLGGTTGANARLLDLYTESIETQRMASLLLISLPADSAHMKLERGICLGLLNLLHSTALWQYPVQVRDRLTIDFTETILSLTPKDKNEEDCTIWLALAVASEWKHCAGKLVDSPVLERHGHDAGLQCQLWLQKSKQLMDWIIVKYERARSWEDIAGVCARFFWLRRLGSEWKLTWKEAMDRRLRNMPRKKSRSAP